MMNTNPPQHGQPQLQESEPLMPGAGTARPSRWWRFVTFPITRIVLFLLLSTAIALGSSLALKGVLHLLHHHTGHSQEGLLTLGEGLAAGSVVLAFWIMVRFADRRSWYTSGLTRRGLMAGLFGGFALGTVILTAGIVLLWLLGTYHVTGFTPSAVVLAPLLTYLCVAVFEETLFRGYFFQTLEGRWGSGVALVVTSLVFGLAHLANPIPGTSFWQHLSGPLFICFEAGLPMGAAYLLTRRWWLSIGMHWAWDFCEGPIYGCPDSGHVDPNTLLHATFSGPALVTGGAFGPESGLALLLVGTLTGALLLRAALRRGQWQPRPSRHT